jgi:hypothetical protein
MAPQGCAILMRVHVRACRRGWCLGYGLDLSRCGNDHGGVGVCTVASMVGGDTTRRGSPWARGGWVTVRWRVEAVKNGGRAVQTGGGEEEVWRLLLLR